MSRISRSKMIFAGGLCSLAFVFFMAMTVQAVSSVAPLQVTEVALVNEATAWPYPAVPPSDGQPGIRPYYLVLTGRDSGKTFTVPVNALILVQVPITPFARLRYDPTILQPVPLPYAPPYPIPMPGDGASGGVPGGAPQPAPAAPATIEPIPLATLATAERDMHRLLLPPGRYGSLLRAINPGTTPLYLMQRPCTTRPCPEMPLFNFSVTITVTGEIVPPPWPYPTAYPPSY